MKKVTSFVCAMAVAGSMAITPAPAQACISNCGKNNAAPLIVLAVLTLIVVSSLGTSASGGLLSSKNEPAKPAKGKVLQKF